MQNPEDTIDLGISPRVARGRLDQNGTGHQDGAAVLDNPAQHCPRALRSADQGGESAAVHDDVTHVAGVAAPAAPALPAHRLLVRFE
jgi:hypothetical protein